MNLKDTFFRKCPYCQRDYKISFLNNYQKQVCFYCLKEFNQKKTKVEEKKYKKAVINDYLNFSLYEYNEYAKDYLYRYKELGDYQIAVVLTYPLIIMIEELVEIYGEITIIPVPSSPKSLKRRGFASVEYILKLVQKELNNYDSIQFLTNYWRLDNTKQGKLSLDKRLKTQHQFGGYNKFYFGQIIIFDDVITTGTTCFNFSQYLKENNEGKEIITLTLFRSKNLL